MTLKEVKGHGFVKTPGIIFAVSFSASDGADLGPINDNARRKAQAKVHTNGYDDGPSM